jgi:hypothetical protein
MVKEERKKFCPKQLFTEALNGLKRIIKKI